MTKKAKEKRQQRKTKVWGPLEDPVTGESEPMLNWLPSGAGGLVLGDDLRYLASVDVVTFRNACARMNRSRQWVYKLVKAGALTMVRRGRHKLILTITILEYFDRNPPATLWFRAWFPPGPIEPGTWPTIDFAIAHPRRYHLHVFKKSTPPPPQINV